MQLPARLALAATRRTAVAATAATAAVVTAPATLSRRLHDTSRKAAVVTPLQGNGPPPAAPVATDPAFREQSNPAPAARANGTAPAADEPASSVSSIDRNSAEDARIVHKRRRQAALLKAARDVKAAGLSSVAQLQKAKSLRKRFWREVHVREVNGSWEVHLDTRPLRHPTTKAIVRVPETKHQLAYGLANEWDQIESVYQATKQHMIPLTSLVCRALDIRDDDAAHAAGASDDSTALAPVRTSVVNAVMCYLDTDGLLCWAPENEGRVEEVDGEEVTLRILQERAARPVMAHLESRVWRGVAAKLRPALDSTGWFTQPQDPAVHEAVRTWLAGLDAFDLAGVERATLAGKSLLAAARLVAQWSESGLEAGAEAGGEQQQQPPFGVEEAVAAVSVEVRWQTGQWGEVEDTHDVEKEDLRRHFGSVVMLVSGTKAPGS